MPRFDVQAPRARLARPRAVSRPRQERKSGRSLRSPSCPSRQRRSARSNPVPALLANRMLRPGDIDMFPDRPRIFKGQPGGRHALADFVKIASAKGLPQPAREIVSAMLVGRDSAWSVEELRPDRRLAARRAISTLPDRPGRRGARGVGANAAERRPRSQGLGLARRKHVAPGCRGSGEDIGRDGKVREGKPGKDEQMRCAGSLRPAAAPLASKARAQSKGPPKASRALVDRSLAWTRP